MSTHKWTITDLIDFDYFLSTGGRSQDASGEQHDRRIFLETIEPRVRSMSPETVPYRRSVFRLWLEHRRTLARTDDPGVVLPGEVFSEARNLLRMSVAVFGLLTGAAAALALLTYAGQTAVNVTMYLGVLIFLQLLSLLALFRFLFVRASMDRLRNHSLLYSLLSRSLESIATRLTRVVMDKAGYGHRQDIRAASGRLRTVYGIYGHVLFWPFFALMQLFGIMFNAGAVAATLTRVLTSDLAFGWQSTLQMSPGAVHTLVRILSAPWAWLLGPHAHPTLEEIEGSRMVLKEGLAAMATGNLVSWWPFLVSAVVCYGLLPRVLLAIASATGERRALGRVRFTHAGCDQLMLRMRSPGVSTAGVPDRPPVTGGSPVPPGSREPVYLSYYDATVLIPEDIMDRCDEKELEHYLGTHLGLNLVGVMPVSGSMDRDRTVIETAVGPHGREDRAVVVVQEAWLPPIAETAALIREVRACGGRALQIAVLLVGRPAEERFLAPVRPHDRIIWNKALAELADPRLIVAAAGDV